MEYVTPTIFSAKYLTDTLLGKTYTPMPNTTLNDKWNVAIGISPIAGSRPIMQYLAIGNGGHTIGNTSGSAPYVVNPIAHKPNHVALYNQIPWVLIPDGGTDLTSTERNNYRMRASVTYGGNTYIGYFLKVIDISSAVPTIKKVSWDNNGKSTTAFTSTDAIQSPTPTTLTGSPQITSDQYLSVDTSIDISLNNTDLAHLQNVFNVIYSGSTKYNIISEIGLYQGIDISYNSPIDAVNYTETIYTQPSVFANVFIATEYVGNVVNLTIDLGTLEPVKF